MDRVSDIEFFQTLCSFESFKSAAQFLGVTPSAVSQRLSALENRLGVILIRRSTRCLRITEEGRYFLDKSSALLTELSKVEQTVSTLSDTLQGTVRINAPFGYGRKVLAGQLARFKNCYPLIKPELILSETPLDIIKGGFDLAIHVGVPKDSRLIARLLQKNKKYLCCAPDYLASHPINRFLDLSQADGIMFLEGGLTGSAWRLSNGSRQELVKPKVAMQTNSGEVALHWALNGLGVLLRSEWAIKPYLQSGKLVKILPQWSVAADIHAVYAEDRRFAYRTHLLMDFLQQHKE